METIVEILPVFTAPLMGMVGVLIGFYIGSRK
jgi:hypothetical protein